jgi:putative cell wall-binding protein
VTTATRRLRRTGAASLVAAVTAGVTLIATAGSAFALTVTAYRLDPASAMTTVNPGNTAAAAGSTQISLPNTGVSIGNTIVLKLEGAGVNQTLTNEGVGFAVAPTITVSGPFTTSFGAVAGTSTDVTPTFTTALGSSAGAATTLGIKDEDTITFTNSSSGTVGDFYTIEVAGVTLKVGSAAVNGVVQVHPYVSDGGASLAGAITVATVSNTSAALTEVSAAPSSTATLNTLTLSEVTAGALLPTAGSPHNIVLTLAGTGATGTFVTTVTPTVTVPAGYTVGTIVVAAGSITIPVSTPTTALAAVVTVAGIQVTVGATTGVLNLTATTGTVWGSAVAAVGVLNQSRVGGTDRYATAGLLFGSPLGTYTGGTNSVAVIASGANFPDALSANYLAAGLNAGAGTRVLLTDPNVLPQPTTQALITGSIKTVFLVGGTAAISTNVSNAIAAMHVGNNNANAFINVIRVAGADRYATNNQVDLYNGASSGHTAIVAVGSNFADALSVAPAVVSKKYPLVLTDGAALSSSAQSSLVNLGITNVIIVGGTSALSATVEASIKALGITINYRIAGADRTLTAQMIATWETTTAGTQAFAATSSYALLNGLGFSKASADVARGDGFADALAAGTVAGAVVTAVVAPVVANAVPILLTGDPNTLGAGIPAFLSGKSATLGTVTFLGLTSAVSVATANAVIASIS